MTAQPINPTLFPVKVSNGSLFYICRYVGDKQSPYMTRVKSINDLYPLSLKDPSAQESYLKASVKYMVTDDLVITPLSSILTVSILSKLKVSLEDVEEREVVDIGIEDVRHFFSY